MFHKEVILKNDFDMDRSVLFILFFFLKNIQATNVAQTEFLIINDEHFAYFEIKFHHFLRKLNLCFI